MVQKDGGRPMLLSSSAMSVREAGKLRKADAWHAPDEAHTSSQLCPAAPSCQDARPVDGVGVCETERDGDVDRVGVTLRPVVGEGDPVEEAVVKMTAQAVPLVHVDVTVVPEKEMALSGTPRALANA
jgi:hypothetical protein